MSNTVYNSNITGEGLAGYPELQGEFNPGTVPVVAELRNRIDDSVLVAEDLIFDKKRTTRIGRRAKTAHDLDQKWVFSDGFYADDKMSGSAAFEAAKKSNTHGYRLARLSSNTRNTTGEVIHVVKNGLVDVSVARLIRDTTQTGNREVRDKDSKAMSGADTLVLQGLVERIAENSTLVRRAEQKKRRLLGGLACGVAAAVIFGREPVMNGLETRNQNIAQQAIEEAAAAEELKVQLELEEEFRVEATRRSGLDPTPEQNQDHTDERFNSARKKHLWQKKLAREAAEAAALRPSGNPSPGQVTDYEAADLNALAEASAIEDEELRLERSAIPSQQQVEDYTDPAYASRSKQNTQLDNEQLRQTSPTAPTYEQLEDYTDPDFASRLEFNKKLEDEAALSRYNSTLELELAQKQQQDSERLYTAFDSQNMRALSDINIPESELVTGDGGSYRILNLDDLPLDLRLSGVPAWGKEGILEKHCKDVDQLRRININEKLGGLGDQIEISIPRFEGLHEDDKFLLVQNGDGVELSAVFSAKDSLLTVTYAGRYDWGSDEYEGVPDTLLIARMIRGKGSEVDLSTVDSVVKC